MPTLLYDKYTILWSLLLCVGWKCNFFLLPDVLVTIVVELLYPLTTILFKPWCIGSLKQTQISNIVFCNFEIRERSSWIAKTETKGVFFYKLSIAVSLLQDLGDKLLCPLSINIPTVKAYILEFTSRDQLVLLTHLTQTCIDTVLQGILIYVNNEHWPFNWINEQLVAFLLLPKTTFWFIVCNKWLYIPSLHLHFHQNLYWISCL